MQFDSHKENWFGVINSIGMKKQNLKNILII